MRRGPVYRTLQPSGGTGSQVSHFVAHLPPEMQPPASTLGRELITISVFALVEGVEAEGFEPPGGCPPLAFKVVDPAISDDHPSSMGRS
jgi:hypothetical protein